MSLAPLVFHIEIDTKPFEDAMERLGQQGEEVARRIARYFASWQIPSKPSRRDVLNQRAIDQAMRARARRAARQQRRQAKRGTT